MTLNIFIEFWYKWFYHYWMWFWIGRSIYKLKTKWFIRDSTVFCELFHLRPLDIDCLSVCEARDPFLVYAHSSRRDEFLQNCCIIDREPGFCHGNQIHIAISHIKSCIRAVLLQTDRTFTEQSWKLENRQPCLFCVILFFRLPPHVLLCVLLRWIRSD